MSKHWIPAGTWLPVDVLLAATDDRPIGRRLGYHTLPDLPPPPAPANPRHRETPIGYRWPSPSGPSPWPPLVERLDRAVGRLRAGGNRWAGRGAALRADPELAAEVYALVRKSGVDDALRGLGIARQTLRNAWIHHGWPAPLGSGHQRGVAQ
jgi:hypothetical protein